MRYRCDSNAHEEWMCDTQTSSRARWRQSCAASRARYGVHLNHKPFADVFGAGTTVDDGTDARSRGSSGVLHSLRRLIVVSEAHAPNRFDSVIPNEQMAQGVGDGILNVIPTETRRLRALEMGHKVSSREYLRRGLYRI